MVPLKQMQTTIAIDESILRNAIEHAHVRYWGTLTHDDKTGWYNVVETEVTDDTVTQDLDEETVLRGFQTLVHNAQKGTTYSKAKEYAAHLAALLSNTGDGFTGDALIQCAIFGELKYG